MATMSKAVDRRHAAIRDLVERFLPAPYASVVADTTAERIVTAIEEELRPLGKTDRWNAALDRWQKMAREYDAALDWVIVQGSIYAGYGAL